MPSPFSQHASVVDGTYTPACVLRVQPLGGASTHVEGVGRPMLGGASIHVEGVGRPMLGGARESLGTVKLTLHVGGHEWMRREGL